LDQCAYSLHQAFMVVFHNSFIELSHD
jgi:hypothetical protein